MAQVAASVAEHDQESSFPPRNQRREDSQIIAHYRRVSLESVQRLLIVFRASKLGGSVAGLMKTVGKVLPGRGAHPYSSAGTHCSPPRTAMLRSCAILCRTVPGERYRRSLPQPDV